MGATREFSDVVSEDEREREREREREKEKERKSERESPPSVHRREASSEAFA